MEQNPFQSPQTPLARSVLPARTYEARIIAVAQGQKWIRTAVAATLIALVLGIFAALTGIERLRGPTGGLTAAGGLCAMIGTAIVAQHSLGSRFLAFVLCVVALLPLVNLAILIWLDMRATRILQAEGIPLGPLGADIRRLQAAAEKRP